MCERLMERCERRLLLVCVCVYHDNLLKAQPFVHTTTQSILNFRLPHLYLLLFFAQRRVQGRAKRRLRVTLEEEGGPYLHLPGQWHVMCELERN